jgi:hypothetical protein
MIKYLNHQLKFFIRTHLIRIFNDTVVNKNGLQVETELLRKYLAATNDVALKCFYSLHGLPGKAQPLIKAKEAEIKALPVLPMPATLET